MSQPGWNSAGYNNDMETHDFSGGGRNATATILLVEDEPSICVMVRMYLEGTGYHVIEAPDAERALALWQTHKSEIDLVLTDVMIPGAISGRQLAQLLQADRPELKVIFMSGHSVHVLGGETFLDGNTKFLSKPYRLNSLAEMVHDCLLGQMAA